MIISVLLFPLLLLVVAAVSFSVAHQGVAAFVSSVVQQRGSTMTTKTRQQQRSWLFRALPSPSGSSSSSTSSTEEVIGDSNNEEKEEDRTDDDPTNKLAAILALQTLQSRQENDLEETKRLLDLMLSSSHHQDETTLLPTHALSTAASLLSGVDYGFISRSEGPQSNLKSGWQEFDSSASETTYGGPPANLWKLGWQQFHRNLDAMKGEYRDEDDIHLTPQQLDLQSKLEQLKLNSTQIWEKEYADGPIQAPWIIKLPYLAVCYLLDVVFEHRFVPSRFFLLETVARMPYFSYITMLHLYETLGFWRRSADVKRIHFAEELNEYRHLLIMESLGGDQAWWVRFTAQHSAIVYYVILCFLFALSPTLSYRFSELLETHAVHTYSTFLENNEKLLKELPPSKAAVHYYSLGTSDPFYSEFQTAALASGKELRRPGDQMRNLHDVFSAICADEGDHVSTMAACLDPQASLQSPSVERRILTGIALVAAASVLATATGIFDPANLLTDTTTTGVDVDAAVATTTVDAATLVDVAVAGVAGLAGKVAQDEETRNMAEKAGVEMVEGSVFVILGEQVRRATIVILEWLTRIRF